MVQFVSPEVPPTSDHSASGSSASVQVRLTPADSGDSGAVPSSRKGLVVAYSLKRLEMSSDLYVFAAASGSKDD
jgi:hypothetical protein